MANIGATTAFYKVETSLTRANNEVSKSMERLATGKQNANAGDRSSYVAMSDTFRLDYVGTKAGIKGASVAMGYLETGMRVLDSASALLSRLQELAVLGANNTNTTADNEAINLEAEAIADEFNRLMTTSTYKGKDVFTTAAGDQELAMGGRGAEMTFGVGDISYTALYSSSNRSISGEPNNGESFNLMHLPSDAITAKTYGSAVAQTDSASAALTLAAGKKYVVRGIDTATDEVDMTDSTTAPSAASILTAVNSSNLTIKSSAGANVTGSLASGQVIDVTTASTITQVNVKRAGSLVTASDKAGEILTVAITTGTTDAARTQGTYNVTLTSPGGGDNQVVKVTVNTAGTASVALVSGSQGSLFDTTTKHTIAGATFGGGANLVLENTNISKVADRVSSATYTIGASDYTTSGSGSGATFTLQVDGDDEVNVVSITNGGTGFAAGDTIRIDGSDLGHADGADVILTVGANGLAASTSVTYAEVKTDENAFKSTETYVIQSLGSVNSSGTIATADSDAGIIAKAFTTTSGAQLTGSLSVGQKIKFASVGETIGGVTVTQQHLDAANALVEGMTFTMASDTLTKDIESIQALVNRARVEAGSQYAALESAVSYTTDLTAQYELGYNTVNDVNFSAETAHLAKNQILQQAATAMLAQANSGQQGLLQLIQG
jgi:flagellin